MNLYFPISPGIAGCGTEYSGWYGGCIFIALHGGYNRPTTIQDYGKLHHGYGPMPTFLFRYGCC
jgi:hypothetical protein